MPKELQNTLLVKAVPASSIIPLYPEPPWLYWDVEALIALATFKAESVKPLLPNGVEVLGDDVIGAVWIAKYPRSTLGPYNEAIIALQVALEGKTYYYIPFIYVDSDAALAAGREAAGAPKKYAKITLEWRGRTVIGEAERAGMAIRLGVTPEYQANRDLLTGLMPAEGIPLLGLRVIPAPGSKGYAELVEWHAKAWLHEAMGGLKAWSGKAALSLTSGAEDDVGSLAVSSILEGYYLFFDMELRIDRIIGRIDYAG